MLSSGFTVKKSIDKSCTFLFSMYICRMRPWVFIFVFVLLSPLCLGESLSDRWKPVNRVFDSLAVCMEKASFKDENLMRLYPVVRQMYRLADTQQNNVMLARAMFWESAIQISIDRDSSEYLITQATEMTDSIEYSYDYARMLLVKQDILRSKGYLLQAYRIDKFLEAYFTECKDNFYLAKTHVAIGVMLREIQEFEKAVDYLTKAATGFRKVGSKNCEIKNRLNIGNTLYNLGKKEKALKLMKELIQNPVVRKDTAFLVNAMISLYSISDMQENRYLPDSYRLAKETGNRQLIAITLVSMGADMLVRQKNDSALYYYRKAYRYAHNYSMISNLFPTLLGLSEAYFRLNRSDSAYYYLKEYEICRDSLLDYDKVTEVNRSESRAAIEKYESDIRQAKEKVRLQTKITGLVVVSSVILLLLVGWILWLLRKKEKIKQQLKESENRELALQNLHFQNEIDSKNRELTTGTLSLAEKNQAFKTLLKEVEGMSLQGSLPGKEATILKKKIKEQLKEGDEWQYFRLQFENVHPNFFLKLKETFPALSENDMRLCAYIRISMTTRQLSLMLSVLPDTIITTRYRIRKKLGLLQDESLEDFLRTFV